jgi:parvulin-like peptidyl-prolyl isomerase
VKRLIKEPLVHFVVLGALLFAGYGWLNRHVATAPEQGRIVISQGQLASMREIFLRTMQRPPTGEEWEGLIQDRVREEVYYREAMALGLDKDDTVIRRRLRQKMEFISDDTAAQAQPTDAELNAYLQARVEQQFTFRQLYLNPAKHGTNLARDAVQLLAKLNQAGADAGWAAMGDSFMLDNSYTVVPAGEIARQFGQEFASKLRGLAAGHWLGPVESAFGMHLVHISQRTEGRLPMLAEVRDGVVREWENNRRVEENEKFYQDLLKHYAVTIEETKPPAEPRKIAKSP